MDTKSLREELHINKKGKTAKFFFFLHMKWQLNLVAEVQSTFNIIKLTSGYFVIIFFNCVKAFGWKMCKFSENVIEKRFCVLSGSGKESKEENSETFFFEFLYPLTLYSTKSNKKS